MKKIEDDKIIIYPRLSKYIFFATLSLIFTGLSLLFVFIGFKITLGFIDVTIKEGYSYSFVAIIGIIGLLIFGFVTFYYFYRLFTWRPSIILDRNGIYDNASFTSAGFLAWNDIDEVCIYKQQYKIGSQRILGIKVKNNEDFIQRFHGVKHLFIKVSNYPVNIPQNTVNIDLEELYKRVSHHVG